jgi:Ca-activated chloride channel family protein
MRKAAEFGRGTFTHIGSTSEVKVRMDAIFRKLERPVLTDIQVQGFEATAELFPSRIPDLYDGEPVVLAFKTSTVPSEVTLTGTFNAGTWKKTVEVAGAPSRNGLSIYWASRKIESLLDRNRFDGGEGGIRQSVLAIALAHHLVSPYTSLVAIDTEPIRPNDASVITHAMKTNLPEGQHYQAIFGLPRTATNGLRHIVIGFLALASVSWMWLRRYRIA